MKNVMSKLVKSFEWIVGRKNKASGFSLIELLVTISIIALLATVAIPMYQNAIKSGRDAKRQADLKGIQSALEQFHSDHIYYPSNSPICTGIALFKTGCPLYSADSSKIYLNKIGTDPSLPSNLDYCYAPSNCDSSNPPKCTGAYKLYANLERPSTTDTYSCNNQTYNFEVTAP
jgi:prepilin-type N-terminal cleavage/methylation domain-containing protein